MFYQDNNDYMRDSYFYGYGNSNCPYSNSMIYRNVQNPYMQNNYQNYTQQNPGNSLENMYPQIYKIINPVANRVIASSNYQFMTEDVLNNMVDTVYSIVEGDVSSLINTSTLMQGDDAVTNSNTTTNNMTNSRTQTTPNNSSNDRRGNSSSMDNQTNSNRLLKDLIKIIIIKELISRRNNFNNSFWQSQGMQMNYDPKNYYSVY